MFAINHRSWIVISIILIVVVFIPNKIACADYSRTPVTSEEVQTNLDFVWICLAAILVFFMKAGFSMVEIGFTRGKNAVNAIMKNVMDFAVRSIAFWAFGFGLMFGTTNGLFGIDGFFLHNYAESQDPWLYSFWVYQLVFVSSVAAIVSGAMAERTRFAASMMFTLAMAVFIYPIFGSWVWGGLHDGNGWLARWFLVPESGNLRLTARPRLSQDIIFHWRRWAR